MYVFHHGTDAIIKSSTSLEKMVTLVTLLGYICSHAMTTSHRFKCEPQILGSLSIHIFKLLLFVIIRS